MLGFALALLTQAIFSIGNWDLALPGLIVYYGAAMSLLLSSAARMLFPPVTGQLRGAHAPAHWLKQAGECQETTRADIRVLKSIFVIVTVGLASMWMVARHGPGKPQVAGGLVVLLVLYQLWKRDG